jgi:hypothetical protein
MATSTEVLPKTESYAPVDKSFKVGICRLPGENYSKNINK